MTGPPSKDNHMASTAASFIPWPNSKGQAFWQRVCDNISPEE